MKKYINQLHQFWIDHFWTRPNNLKALRIVLSALFGLFLFYFIGFPKHGLLAGMGIVAAALTERDIHVKSAIKSTVSILVLFFIFSALTRILSPYPIAFGVFLVTSTFFLTIMGGYRAKFANLGFGSVLIILYTMIINTPNEPWYITPILFCSGVLIYMLSTIVAVIINPFQPLQHNITNGYRMLVKYLQTKAKFFPSTKEEQEEIRNELALINIELFSQTENIKSLLLQYNAIIPQNQKSRLQQYIQEWNRLQILHERAVSSHEPYDLISQNNKDTLLVKGFGKYLYEIGEAIDLYANSLLNQIPYKPSSDLIWTKEALKELMKKYGYLEKEGSIGYLYKNLSSIEESLTQELSSAQLSSKVKPTRVAHKDVFSIKNNIFRHAIRLSVCFLAGYIIMAAFELELGAWIMLTSFIVCQQTYNATRQRFFKRIVGTMLGVFIGIILAILVPTPMGQLIILLAGMYLFFKYLSSNYIVAAIFITVYVLEVYNLQNGSGIAVMLPRIVDTLIGSVLAYLSLRFIWPEWQYKNLKPLLIKAIDRNKRYLKGVMDKNIPDDVYLHNQRSAHRADNALTQVWKSMRIEPKSKRSLLTSARNFTYLNHTLISYISAMGAHRKNLDFNPEDFTCQTHIMQILEETKAYIETGKSPTDVALNTWSNDINETQELLEKKGNNLFLNNILNISNEMKEAALGIRF